MPNLDPSSAIEKVCETLATLGGLSDGAPTKIDESSLQFPEFDTANGLPWMVVQTTDEMPIDWNYAPRQVQNTVPLTVWYIRDIPAEPGQTMRADGALIANTFWLSNLEGTCDQIRPVGINWSDTNEFNDAARENKWGVCGVAVRLEMTLSASR